MNTTLILNLMLLSIVFIQHFQNKRLKRMNEWLNCEFVRFQDENKRLKTENKALKLAYGISVVNSVRRKFFGGQEDAEKTLDEQLKDALASENYELAKKLQEQINKQKP